MKKLVALVALVLVLTFGLGWVVWEGVQWFPVSLNCLVSGAC